MKGETLFSTVPDNNESRVYLSETVLHFIFIQAKNHASMDGHMNDVPSSQLKKYVSYRVDVFMYCVCVHFDGFSCMKMLCQRYIYAYELHLFV